MNPPTSKPLSIVHVTPYYAPAWAYGGVVRAVYGLAKAQARAGQRVTVLTTDTLAPGQRSSVQRETLDDVAVIRCRNRIELLRRVNLSSPIGLRRTLASLFASPDPPDVIHCHELRTVENLLTMPIASVHGTRLVVSPHGTLPANTGRSTVKRVWDILFGRTLARRFSGVIALTESEAEVARGWWQSLNAPMPSLAVIPNGVDAPDNAEPRPERHSDGPVVLFVGRLHERKGIQFLIPAFAQAIRAEGLSNARLLIVGPDEGMLANTQRLAAECGIADRVKFAGLLTGTARDEALANADLFVLPAIGEGLSIAALEAMAAGLPVILTPGCNLPEAEARGAGVIVPREILPLAGAIQALLLNPMRRASMGDAGQRWMCESFAWPAVAELVVEFYRQVNAG
ncbi:MAG: glycosyltransferase [Aggregatilineales bacterium]